MIDLTVPSGGLSVSMGASVDEGTPIVVSSVFGRRNRMLGRAVRGARASPQRLRGRTCGISCNGT